MDTTAHRQGYGQSRRRKSSKYVSERQAQNLLDALVFADQMGFPLNMSIDICWSMFLGFTHDSIRIARCQERLSKWCKRRNFPLTMIWVREIGKNGGANVHILMHVPPWLMSTEFKSALERALEPEGGPSHAKAIMIKPAYRPLGKLLYSLKGLQPREARQFGVRASFQGIVEGKRVGTTENIGVVARTRVTAI
jgi:hypothetical protein